LFAPAPPPLGVVGLPMETSVALPTAGQPVVQCGQTPTKDVALGSAESSTGSSTTTKKAIVPPTPIPAVQNTQETTSSKRKRTPSWRVKEQEQDAQEAKLRLHFAGDGSAAKPERSTNESKRESGIVGAGGGLTSKKKKATGSHLAASSETRDGHKKGSMRPPPKTLEELACRVIEILQTHGMVSTKTIHDIVKVESRYVQAVLDVLHATPLVTMIRRKDGKEELYLYRGGIPIREAVDLKTIEEQQMQERDEIAACQERLEILEKAAAQQHSPAEILAQLVDRQPAFKQDPVYRVIKRQVLS